MIVNTINVNDCTPQTIVIGRRATYDTLQVFFDLSYLAETYGSGAAVLVVKRSQDETAYPATITQDGNTLTWTISETDTYYVGAGECELMWYVNDGLAKTIIYPVVVLRDMLQTTEEPPDAYENWVEHLTALGAETQQNALDAAQSATDAEQAKDDAVAAKEAAEAALEEFTIPTASATTLSAGSQATATYSDGNFAFGIPKGADGDPGDPGVTPDFSIGTVTTLEPTQPATASITGTAEAPVLNLGIPKGAKGDPGQGCGSVDSVNGQTGDVVLDAGDVGFDDTETYAAGSVGAELSQQKNAISQLEDVLNIADDKEIIEVTRLLNGGYFDKFESDVYYHTSGTKYTSEYAVTAGDAFSLEATSTGDISYTFCFVNRNLPFYGSASIIGNSYTTSGAASVDLEVPTGASFLYVTADYTTSVVAVRNSGKKSERLDGIESDITGLESDISELNTIVPAMDESLKNVAKSVGKHTMFVETWAAFPYRKLPTSFNQTNPFVVTGSSGDSVVSIVSGGATLASSDENSGLVIQGDSGEWSTHLLVSYTANSITIYPALPDDVTEGILAPFAFDTQHLTKYGYMAYMQHINAANPKHCEKNKYVAKYHPVIDSTPSPFTWYGISKDAWTYALTDSVEIIRQYGGFGTLIYPYVNYSTTGKYGAYWTVDTGNNAGYLETFVGVVNRNVSSMAKDQGYLMHIVVSADGQVIYQKDKDSNVVERICVDFTESQKNIKLEIYYDTMRANSADSIFIGETTFWINEKYPDNILPAGSTVSMLFDSWGAFHSETTVTELSTPWHNGATWSQGQSGETLKQILKDKSGFVCPVFNTSRGDMTSRWGKAWFGVAVREKMPNVVLTDFGINDYHTTFGGVSFEDIPDPYGNMIIMQNNPLTKEEYANNMKAIFDMAIMSDIQPVFIEPDIGSSLEWTLDLLYRLSEQVT